MSKAILASFLTILLLWSGTLVMHTYYMYYAAWLPFTALISILFGEIVFKKMTEPLHVKLEDN